MTAWIFVIVFLGLVDGHLAVTRPAEVLGPFLTTAHCERVRELQRVGAGGLPIAVGPCVEKDEAALRVLREKGLLRDTLVEIPVTAP